MLFGPQHEMILTPGYPILLPAPIQSPATDGHPGATLTSGYAHLCTCLLQWPSLLRFCSSAPCMPSASTDTWSGEVISESFSVLCCSSWETALKTESRDQGKLHPGLPHEKSWPNHPVVIAWRYHQGGLSSSGLSLPSRISLQAP